MDSGIVVMPKPDYISWAQIKQLLSDAHKANREKGINMSHYQWEQERFAAFFSGEGELFVAMEGDKLVGTLGVVKKSGNRWYLKGNYAYFCFGSILPTYNGRGIYRSLNVACEQFAKTLNLDVAVLDTHFRNKHMQLISQNNGYRKVRFFRASTKDHYSVVMAKCLDGRSYSRLRCAISYYSSIIWTFSKSLYSMMTGAK